MSTWLSTKRQNSNLVEMETITKLLVARRVLLVSRKYSPQGKLKEIDSIILDLENKITEKSGLSLREAIELYEPVPDSATVRGYRQSELDFLARKMFKLVDIKPKDEN